MKLADALAIKARELGMHNMAVLPKLSEEERRKRSRESSRKHRRSNRDRVNQDQRNRYAATKNERDATQLPEFTGFYLTKCPDCDHTKPTAAQTPTQCPQCGRYFDPVTNKVEQDDPEVVEA